MGKWCTVESTLNYHHAKCIFNCTILTVCLNNYFTYNLLSFGFSIALVQTSVFEENKDTHTTPLWPLVHLDHRSFTISNYCVNTARVSRLCFVILSSRTTIYHWNTWVRSHPLFLSSPLSVCRLGFPVRRSPLNQATLKHLAMSTVRATTRKTCPTTNDLWKCFWSKDYTSNTSKLQLELWQVNFVIRIFAQITERWH